VGRTRGTDKSTTLAAPRPTVLSAHDEFCHFSEDFRKKIERLYSRG